MSAIPGVVSTEVGYANGDPSLDPSYEEVCRRTTGYRETVHVLYDPAEVSTDYLVYAFYSSIDPSMENGQGNDRGRSIRRAYSGGIRRRRTPSEGYPP